MSEWQPIETAPELERVYVCGWQKASGTCRGYWWWDEGMFFDGLDPEHPDASHWFPIVLPDFPPEPKP